MSGLFVKKPLSQATGDDSHGKGLNRVLGPVQLIALGIGAVIGAGIFVATGAAAKNTAGPALIVSYCVAGFVCLLAALCYAEYAALTPVAGSAYTYAYTTLGELMAWIIGWDLILEYCVGASTVANGWSGYLQDVLKAFNFELPSTMQKAYWKYDKDLGEMVKTGSYINLPAVLIVLLLTGVLVKGIKESATFNAVMVALKVGVVLFVILVGAFYVNPENWKPFAPYGWSGFTLFNFDFSTMSFLEAGKKPTGMLAGAATIFFAYIGFDAVSTQAEEAKNPQRNVPIGIIGSLLICTVLYIAVVAVLTGMVPYKELNEEAGVSSAFKNVKGIEYIVAAAGVAGITSVLLVMLLGSARILMAMSRDGLLPKFFSDIHPTFKTPWKCQIVVGIFAAVMAGLLPIDALLDMTNIGTLFAFAIVCGAVLVLRYKNPDAPRPFRCPMVPVVPVLGILGCLLLMCSLHYANWLRLFAWMGLGLIIYFTYSRSHSHLGNPGRATA